MSDYVTPATMPIARSEQTQPIETARVMPPVVEPLPPTDPLPAIPPAPPAVADRRHRCDRSGIRYLIRGAGWAAMLLLLVAIITTEGVAWVAAERFRHSLDGIDGRPLAETRASYEGIRARSMLGTGLHASCGQVASFPPGGDGRQQ